MFTNVTCTEAGDTSYSLCFKLTFPYDQQTDFVLLHHIAGHTYKGTLKDEGGPVLFSFPDYEEDPPEETAEVHTHTYTIRTIPNSSRINTHKMNLY